MEKLCDSFVGFGVFTNVSGFVTKKQKSVTLFETVQCLSPQHRRLLFASASHRATAVLLSQIFKS